MTNEEALEVLRTSSWMCLSNNSIKFQEAIEHAYNNLKRVEKISEENARLLLNKTEKDLEIVDLIEKNAELTKEIERLTEKCRVLELFLDALTNTDDYENLEDDE